MTDDKVMASRYQIVSALRLNDVVTIVSKNDVLNVVTYDIAGFSKMLGEVMKG